jgi:Zn-finger nucleic acid-binding protein
VRESAEREDQRLCPVDGAAMRKFIIKDIILDHCPTCRGFWLDGGEMAKIKHHARQEGDGFGAGFIAGMIIG